jgi:formylglycine-generating enzyme required for sulfatase activity
MRRIGLVIMAMVLIGPGELRPARAAPATFKDCGDCSVMVRIPAGRFAMGSPADEPGRQPAEGPVHEVAIARPFAMAKFDVTRAQFAAFAEATGYDSADARCDWRNPKSRGQPLNQGPDEPVVCVNWADAQAYVAWLRRLTGKPYRLPSEAEWEYAARAGSAAARPWGPGLTRDKANYGADPCCGPAAEGADNWLYTSPVGAFPANRFGLADMIGNVWQWVEDCGSEDYRGAPASGAAWTGGDCKTHVVRGGAWFQGPESARSAARAADATGFRIGDIGFRVALSLPLSIPKFVRRLPQALRTSESVH